MRRLLLLALAEALVLASTAAGTPPRVTPVVRHQVEQLKAARGTPLYYLGLRWRGLTLVKVDRGSPTDLYYADCSADEVSVGGLACHSVVDIELWQPEPGEISTQGRCTFSTTVRGVTAALFPVNPHTLRVFTRRTSIEISAASRAEMLGAAHDLRGLNIRIAAGAPLPPRDVSRQLGRCRAARVRAQPPQTAKQAYEQRMKGSFTAESASTLNLSVVNSLVANPRAIASGFLNDARTFSLLLRTEAQRLELIRPPREVAALHARLIRELRAYATEVDAVARVVRSGVWRNNATWPAAAQRLETRMDARAGAIVATVRIFAKRGYTISARSH
jgi:hypothetical protein